MIKESVVKNALENIYISPLELCNLNCKLCYTKKTKNILTNGQILEFIERYASVVDLKSITFCGGEVFSLKDFPELINILQGKGIFVSIITNGTIDVLTKIKEPYNCQLLVSLDGPKNIHDDNRGEGNFDKSIDYIKHALSLGFPLEIMFLVTTESYCYKDIFPKLIEELTGNSLNLNYITQKTFFYTEDHPLSNNNNRKNGLSPEQIIDIKKNYHSLPSKNFGCFQLSLQSNGNIYGCCESPKVLSKMKEPVEKIITEFKNKLVKCSSCKLNYCFGCVDPDFLCGYKNELKLEDCKKVVDKFCY